MAPASMPLTAVRALPEICQKPCYAKPHATPPPNCQQRFSPAQLCGDVRPRTASRTARASMVKMGQGSDPRLSRSHSVTLRELTTCRSHDLRTASVPGARQNRLGANYHALDGIGRPEVGDGWAAGAVSSPRSVRLRLPEMAPSDAPGQAGGRHRFDWSINVRPTFHHIPPGCLLTESARRHARRGLPG